MEQVIEVVNYKVADGVTEDQLLAASDKIVGFLNRMEGFLYRSLSFNPENDVWTDTVYWQNLDNAKAASAEFMSAPETQEYASKIQMESVNMQHQLIKSDTGCSN
ncbi:conserved hypothetical protein [Vibrio nigripulchritudo MADA3029]|uniref:ABM domain-containing protein n=1 Tax=Vibrio nigripulchritudo SOn1 TaxID=1238450 RepID=A0AAV2VPI5_9VIBR|nr:MULTISPECIES: hypothetical protein [Vibrio]EGU60553.1 hypothetical protein VINI7043_25157 [Vibrio nigripulchritudo ATCC 27043]KJY74671.1 hypothetical protein TW74_18280 [Vibrio nigripulchritudo]UAB73990.1 hypothetical protein INR79_22915 [Vibrio sp. SCSIO 43132]CCN45468.1 conserved hypothetical protein [Vibrio nigripulchritudo MADA3020]CCN56368.1 conserved hypothetical protein [Vibrio nigripulchritudo MADA3021]